MPQGIVRSSLDIPDALHRRLREAAARKACSARQLILESIERVIQDSEPHRPQKRPSLDPSIVPSKGKPFDLTNEQIHELLELP